MEPMRRLMRHREAITIIGVVLLMAIVGLFNLSFVGPANLTRILNAGLILALMAAGATPVIITRNIDVSVGSILALSGIIGARMMTNGTPLALAAATTIATGVVLGLINGALVVYGHVPSIVATLGTMAAYRGTSFMITGGVSIDQIPPAFSGLGGRSVLGVPLLAWVTVLVVVLIGLFLSRTTPGRHIYATGDNAEGARLIGVRVNAMVIGAYALSGLFAAIASLVFIAQVGSITNQAGQGMEMRAIAAAVIGGVALSGGVGTILGSFAGALFITTATSALSFMGVPGFWSDAVIGAILLLALFADARIRQSLDARRAVERYRARLNETPAQAALR